jgi:caffeoyl-CoA O-methyltransferase
MPPEILTVPVTQPIQDYILAHGTPPTDVQRRLIDETAKLGTASRMQISPDQGAFMTLLTRLVGARNAVEVGTFTGYSALAIAYGLPDDGRLLCCDVNEEWTAIGRRHWDEAGVGHKIELRIAPALETLKSLPADEPIDLAFIDADKPNYISYANELIPRLRTNGVLLVDNVLWSGRVVDESENDENTVAIRTFNDALAADDRVDVVMLAIRDGLTVARKR